MVKMRVDYLLLEFFKQMFEEITFSDMFKKELGHAITLLHCKLPESQDIIPSHFSIPSPQIKAQRIILHRVIVYKCLTMAFKLINT